MPPKKAATNAKPASKAVPKAPGRPPASRAVVGAKKTGTALTKAAGAGKNTALGKREGVSPGKKTTKGKDAPASQSKAKGQFKQEKSAVVIQKYARRHLAKNQLQKKKKEKEEYEELMEKLQKEAWLQLVQMEREEAEKERQKEEEERKRRKEEANRRKRILEAAFDGDNDEILAVLEEAHEQDSQQQGLSDAARALLVERHQLALVDCEDANSNTPLSEAGGGGHADTIKLLIQRGADVNSRGRYQRTPVWRAAFAGHLQAVQTLLEHGADPRLVAEDATNAIQVAAIPAVEQVLRGWDIGQTELLLKKLEAQKEQRAAENRKRVQAETSRLEGEISRAEKENEACQKELHKSYEELNKRIFEHDKCMAEGKIDKQEVTLQAIHDAEAVLELAKKKADAARERLEQVKLKLRDQHKQEEESSQDGEQLKGVKVIMKELDDVLFRDVGGKIAADGRWPLLIDSSKQSSTFLRYRDTNFLCAVSPKDMEPESIRLAILGAIRYGKPAVIDMMDVNMFDALALKFDAVQAGLLASLMSKDLLKEERYLQLVKPGDGEEYSKTNFLGARIEKFIFILLTKQWKPPDHVMDQTYPIRVIIPSAPI